MEWLDDRCFSQRCLGIGEERYAYAAEKAVEFLLKNLRSREGLLARYRGEAAYLAYLDDYAFAAWGLWELYQATFQVKYLEESLRITREMYELFWDPEDGGFILQLMMVVRARCPDQEIVDMALPSGNSVAAWNLLHLARLTGNDALEDTAHRQLHAFGGAVARTPQAYTFYLCALDFSLRAASGDRGSRGEGQLPNAGVLRCCVLNICRRQ